MASRRLRNRSRRMTAENGDEEQVGAPEAAEAAAEDEGVQEQSAPEQAVDADAEVSEAFAALDAGDPESSDPFQNIDIADPAQAPDPVDEASVSASPDDFAVFQEGLDAGLEANAEEAAAAEVGFDDSVGSEDSGVDGVADIDLNDDSASGEAAAVPSGRGRRASRRATAADDSGSKRGGARRSRRGTAAQESGEASGSRRSGRQRSSQRSGAASARSSSRKSKAKKVLTPEEKRARKRAMSIASSAVVLVAIVVGLVVGLKILLTEEIVTRTFAIPESDPITIEDTQENIALQALTNARSANKRLADAIDRRDSASAETSYLQALAWLDIPDLGRGEVEIAPVNDPAFASAASVRNAYELRLRIEDQEPAIADLKEARVVADNINIAKAALAGLKLKLTDEALDQNDPERSFVILKTRAATVKELIAAAEAAFALTENVLANPVNPDDQPSEILADKYNSQLTSLQSQLNNSKSAVDTLRRAAVIGPEEGALSISRVLREKMYYGRAVQMINALSELYPDANLASVKAQVVSGAQSKWELTKDTATGHFKDSQSPALAPAQRKQARETALQVLTDVIEKFVADTEPSLGQDPSIQAIVNEATELRKVFTNS